MFAASRLFNISARSLAVGKSRTFCRSVTNLDIVKVPTMAESISEGTLKSWTKSVGDFVKQDEEVAVIETDKIDVTVNAPCDGHIKQHLAAEEDTVAVGQDLFDIEPGQGSSEAPAKEEKKPAAKETKQEPKASQKSEPSKKAVTKETTSSVTSNATKKALPDTKPGTSTTASADTAPVAPSHRSESRVKMSRMRARIAERLKQSQNEAASLTTFNEIDMSALMALRSKHKDDVLKKHGVKLGFMSAFARAATVALQEIPMANAMVENGDTIVYRDYVDLSVAVATPKGLVTPVIRNTETMKNFLDVERAIADAGVKAREGKLTLEDMSGGTFTISNGGVFGSLFGTPIINMPQTAVLGMHAINDRPVVIKNAKGEKEIAIRPVMVVALTYDHRLLDGREAVTFLVRIKQLIEDPSALLLA